MSHVYLSVVFLPRFPDNPRPIWLGSVEPFWRCLENDRFIDVKPYHIWRLPLDSIQSELMIKAVIGADLIVLKRIMDRFPYYISYFLRIDELL